MMYYYWNHPFGGTSWIIMFFVGAIIFTLFLGLLKHLMRTEYHNKSGVKIVEGTPMDILKMRYAKGEINKTEYEEKKKDLA